MLQDLPYEIQCCILKKCKPIDLLVISSTCRHFYNLCIKENLLHDLKVTLPGKSSQLFNPSTINYICNAEMDIPLSYQLINQCKVLNIYHMNEKSLHKVLKIFVKQLGVTKLSFYECSNVSYSFLEKVLQSLPLLSELSFICSLHFLIEADAPDSCHENPQVMKLIRDFSEPVFLSFEACQNITDEILATLYSPRYGKQNFRNLAHINLTSSRVSDFSISGMQKHFKSLKELILDNCIKPYKCMLDSHIADERSSVVEYTVQ